MKNTVRQRLEIPTFRNNTFVQPYYIYDTIDVFDKTTNQYVQKKRTTAISISDTGEIAIATAICSLMDVYSKVKGRTKATNRLIAAIIQFEHTRDLTAGCVVNKNCYVFPDITLFNAFCSMIDSIGVTYFTKYETTYGTSTGVTNKMRINKETISDIYMHAPFVNKVHDKVLESLRVLEDDLDTTRKNRVFREYSPTSSPE